MLGIGSLVSLSSICYGQGVNGTKAYWSYLTDRETIAPASGSVMVKIPLIHLPGRNGHDLNLSMVFNSGTPLGLEYTFIPPSQSNNGYYVASFQQNAGQWRLSTPFFSGAGRSLSESNTTYVSCSNVGLTTEDGASYSFGMASWGCAEYGYGGAKTSTNESALDNPIAADDSGAGIIVDGVSSPGTTVYLPDGTRYIAGANASILDVDSNNNYISYNYDGYTQTAPPYPDQTIVDTLGRTVSITPSLPANSATAPWNRPTAVKYHDSNGVLQVITINYGGSLPATTPPVFQQPTGSYVVWQNNPLSNFSQGNISSIVFPDGSSYSFQYDYLGELIKVGYPDGGYTRYDYAQVPYTFFIGNSGGDLVGVQMQVSAKHSCAAPVVPAKTTTLASGNNCTDPLGELTTTYQPVSVGHHYNTSNTVTGPDGTTTVYQYDSTIAGSASNPLQFPWTQNIDIAPVELSHTTTDSGGTLLEQVTTTYESDWLHPSGRAIFQLYGESKGDVWTYSTTPLNVGSSQPSLPSSMLWTVTSLATNYFIPLQGSNLAYNQLPTLRHDYQWQQAGFDPSQAYFAGLETQDYLYDSLSGGYIEKTNLKYDAGVPTPISAIHSLSYTQSQRGNVTSQMHWSSVDNTWIGTTHSYDDAGNVLGTTDARGNSTQFYYTDQFGVNNSCAPSGGFVAAAYLTRVVNSLGQTASATYNSCTGSKASARDANAQSTNYAYWSPTDQLATVTRPDGGTSSFCYDNIASCSSQSSARNFTISTTTMTPDPSIVKEEDYDGFGRSVASIVASDPCGLKTSLLYDRRERVYQKSFPFFSKTATPCIAQASTPVTTYLYNGLGLPTSVQVTGSAARTWTYAALPSQMSTEIETDENGNQIERAVDGLARLAAVYEPNSGGILANETDYQYDGASNLKQVDQWGGAYGNSSDRQRLFTYDTLSRLTQSLNPEAGTIKYAYDYNGNVTSQTDARNITATRSYDVLNRLTQTLYSDGTPTECFIYDIPQVYENSYPVGRLTAEWTNTSLANCSGGFTSGYNMRVIGSPSTSSGPVGYDAMGRLVSDVQCADSICYSPNLTQYTYDTGGLLSTQTDGSAPTGPVVLTHHYDGAGREYLLSSSWADATHPATLLNVTAWSPPGVASEQLGLWPNNVAAVTVVKGYDTHGRPVSETDTTSAVTAVTAVQATGTIAVSMVEQHTTPAGTPSTGTITFSEPGGTDQYSPACGCYETGIFTVLVDVGTSGQVGYVAMDGTASTPTSIAAGLVSSINTNSASLVTATSTGPTVTMTSKTNGAAADYAFEALSAITNPNFTTSSFVATPANGVMTGGSGGSGTTVYDSGTATATIGTLTPATISWTSADTAATIATRLAAAINTADGSKVTASASGSQISLKAVTAGTAGDLNIQTSETFNNTYFGSSSVTMTPVTTMSGGVNGIAAAPASVAYQYSSGLWRDNGNLGSITDSLLGTQTFAYADHLNRVTSAVFNGAKGNFTLNWTYDAFGNRYQQAVTGTSSLTFVQQSPVAYSATNNRIDGDSYDAAGNDGTAGGWFDAADRIYFVGSLCYAYDAGGRRVAKGTPNWDECEGTTQYILGAGGEQLTELSSAQNGQFPVWKHTNVYGGGKMLATYDANGTHFHLTDWLGTMRAQVNANGVVEETCINMPFGDDQNCSGSGVEATEHHFTGKERDMETGLDYFGARYFSSNAGRWVSPDWSATVAPIPYAKLDDPQTLNLYAYVANNPLATIDADGHSGCSGTQDQCEVTTIGQILAEGHSIAATINQQSNLRQMAAAMFGQGARQQKYDPSKSGPEDPTNPGHPLSQNSVVKKASDQAFMATTNGAARDGLAEAGFSIEYGDGKISIANKVNSVNGDGTPNQLQIKTDANSIAILHIHGNNAQPTPSPGDRNPNTQVPDFVRSRSALYVTVPHSATGSPSLNQYIQLQ
jgi:RHS repeat-associated protein